MSTRQSILNNQVLETELMQFKGGRKESSKNVPRSVFRVAPNGRYFIDPHGAGFHPVGLNAMEELLMQHGVEARCWADHEVEAFFQKLSARGCNYLRLQTSDVLEDPYFTHGRYNEEIERRTDLVIDLAEDHNIAVNLEMFCPHHYSAWYWPNRLENWKRNPYNAENGGPIHYAPEAGKDPSSTEETDRRYRMAYDSSNRASMDAQKRRIRWFVERYSGRRCVFAWGLSNDFPYNLEPETREWLKEMSTYLRGIDTYGHLVAIQTHSGAAWPAWMVDAVDFTSIRAYPWSNFINKPAGDLLPGGVHRNNPVNIAEWLHLKAHEHLAFGKPVINGEFGAMARLPGSDRPGFRVTPDMDRCTLYGLWASLASGASAGHRWCGWDGFFPPTETAWQYISAIARFCTRIDWAGFESRPCDHEISVAGDEVLSFGIRDDKTFLAWVASKDPDNQKLVQPELILNAQMPSGHYEITWIDAETNATLRRTVSNQFPAGAAAPQPFRTCQLLLIQILK